MVEEDIILDILRLVSEEAGREGVVLPDRLAVKVERRARQLWGGCEPYVAHRTIDARMERNGRITAAWSHGERNLATLANRFGLSTKQVRRIIRRP